MINSQPFKLAYDIAHDIADEFNNERVINHRLDVISKLTSVPIKMIKDESIVTPAKIEYAETYKRDHHIVKYKPSFESYAHLLMHELGHLLLAEEARKENSNMLFTSDNAMKELFFYQMKKFTTRLGKAGVPQDSIVQYMKALFEGFNSQIFNTPIDLFIEKSIYDNYPEFRAIQFLSMYKLIFQGIEATTKKSIVDNSPKSILSVSKVLNLVGALQFKELFNVDLIEYFQATAKEETQANQFYEEFEEYKDDKLPAEEYELIQHWGEDLKLDKFFELIPESTGGKKSLYDILSEIESDPYGLNDVDSGEELRMKKFIDAHSNKELNMSIVFYMMDSLNYFNSKSKAEIKATALELAKIGVMGIDPDKLGYHIPSIKRSSFSGYKTLAYYYVSWALAIPEMLSSLQMPFEKEYALASKYDEL